MPGVVQRIVLDFHCLHTYRCCEAIHLRKVVIQRWTEQPRRFEHGLGNSRVGAEGLGSAEDEQYLFAQEIVEPFAAGEAAYQAVACEADPMFDHEAQPFAQMFEVL